MLPTDAAVMSGTIGRSQAAVMVSAACLCCVNMTNGTPNAVKQERAARRGERLSCASRVEDPGAGRVRTDGDPVQDERRVERFEAVLFAREGDARDDGDQTHGCKDRNVSRVREGGHPRKREHQTHESCRGRESASHGAA